MSTEQFCLQTKLKGLCHDRLVHFVGNTNDISLVAKKIEKSLVNDKRKIDDCAYARFWGVNKVQYVLGENS